MRSYPNETIEEAKSLLDQGVSRTEVEKRIGLSKTLVARIARGETTTKKGRGVIIGEEKKKDKELFNRPYSRCPSCGYLVQKPCLLCEGISASKEVEMPEYYEEYDL